MFPPDADKPILSPSSGPLPPGALVAFVFNECVEAQAPQTPEKRDAGLAVIRALLDAGADVNERGEAGFTPLMFAAWFGNEAILQLLLERGADVNKSDDDTGGGYSPLHCAAFWGYEDITRTLLQKGARLELGDAAAATPLLVAAQHGHAPLARLLAEAGANLDARDNQGQTAIGLAMKNGHEGVAMALREAAEIREMQARATEQRRAEAEAQALAEKRIHSVRAHRKNGIRLGPKPPSP